MKPIFAISIIALSLLNACQSTTVHTPSKIMLPEQFQYGSGSQVSDIQQWWQSWHDDVLTQLIEQGLREGLDLKIAQSRFDEAAQIAKLAQADLGAQVGLNGNLAYNRARLNNPISTQTQNALPILPKQDVNSKGGVLNAGLSATWELDFFGGKQSDADAARWQAISVREQQHAAQLLLAANIAEAYVHVRALQQNQQQTERSIHALTQMLHYVQGRFRAGHLSAYEVDAARANLTALQGKQATLDAQQQSYVRQIAVLIGQTPQTFRLPESKNTILNKQPAPPQGSTPEGLLERRPDLRAKAAAIQARAAQLASAKSDLYPRFTLNFLGQGARLEVNSDTALSGWANLLSLGISVPLFTNNRLHSNIAAADARLQTALLEYDQTLLRALAEVDNAYQLTQALAQQSQYLQQSQALYQQQAKDAAQLFRYGNKNLDEVLRAQIQAENAAENLTQAQLARAQSLIGLYKALGGGWQPE